MWRRDPSFPSQIEKMLFRNRDLVTCYFSVLLKYFEDKKFLFFSRARKEEAIDYTDDTFGGRRGSTEASAVRRPVGWHTDRRFFEESTGKINWLPRISLAPESPCNVVSVARDVSRTCRVCIRRRKQTEEFEERGEERRGERGGSSGWLAKWVTAVAAAPSRRIFGNFFASSRPSIFLDFLFSHLSFFIAIIARSAKLSIARNYGTSWETALMIKGALMPARSENPNWPGNFQRFR